MPTHEANLKTMLDFSPEYVSKLREHGRLTHEKKVLDVGCGWGRIFVLLRKLYPLLDLTGLDVSSEFLHVTKRAIEGDEHVNLVLADAENLPLKDDYFDLVYASRILHYLDDPQEALKEFSRVCKKGGTVIIFQPNKRNLLYRAFIGFIGETQRKFFSTERAVELFDKTGLLNVRWGSIGFIPFLWSIRVLNTKVLRRPFEKIQFLSNLGSILYVAGEK